MQKQRIIIPAPSGGLHTAISPTLIGDIGASIAENVEYISGKVRKTPGNYLPVSNSTSITACSDSHEPRALYNFIRADGTEIPIIYERGLTGALSNKIYFADTSTIPWTWEALKYESADLALNSSTTPRFLTMRGKLFFSNGDSTEGLMYWDGDFDTEVVYVRTGGTTSACGRFLIQYKERLGVVNGKYFNDPSWSSHLSSAIFWSSITESDGTPVDPHEPAAWHDVFETYNEIAPQDGSQIVAAWVDGNSVLVAKETGIWRMYGVPKNFTIDPISKVGMESDHSLQKHRGIWTFCNKDGFHVFDGRSQPQRIDEPIRNLVMQIPKFDIGGEADTLNYTIDGDWDTPMDDANTTNINLLAGDDGIEIDTSAISPSPYSYTLSDLSVTCGSTPIRTKYGFKFVPSPASFLSTIKLKMKRGATTTGTFDISVFGDDEGQTGFPVIEMTTPITTNISTLSMTETVETFDFSSQEVKLQNNRHYWVVVTWVYGEVPWFYICYQSGDHSGWQTYTFGEYIYGQWDYTSDKRGYIVADGTEYETQGIYNTTDNYGDLGGIPTEWGQFHAEDTGETGNIEYKIRTSATGSSGWTNWEIVIDGDIPTITVQRYVDYRITLDRISGIQTPQVTVMSVYAYIGTAEVADRLACSTIFEGKYEYATNKNLDGNYRTFVLDNENRWGIKPNQLIRGYMDYKNEKYLLTLDINTGTGVKTAELCKMYRGKKIEEFLYDYSARIPTYRATGTKRNYYSQILRSKKFDCGFPDTIKLFKELQFSVGSIFAEAYLQGTLKYRIDNDDWTTQNFPNKSFQGDAVIRMPFPAGTRGQYIQFEWRTYLSGSTYGHPFNIKDAKLDFFTQKLKPILLTTTSVPSEEEEMVVE